MTMDFTKMTRRELKQWIARRHRAMLAADLSPARRAQMAEAEAILREI